MIRGFVFMERSSGVTAIAILFFLCAGYLCVVALIMLASPGTASMTLGAPLLNGLELAGPYMFFLAGAVGALIGWGLLRLNRWARRAAILVAGIGFVMLVPVVSAAAVDFHWSLLTSGLGMIVRVMVVWYLWQGPVAEEFLQ